MLCDADTDTDTDTGAGIYATGQVEVGGDTDSTEGAEPSHMHGGPGDENYNRGCELPPAHAAPPSCALAPSVPSCVQRARAQTSGG
eukprot:COSAG01_NODE_10282_length_2201_cov_6.031399_6_plen_86_part_00